MTEKKQLCSRLRVSGKGRGEHAITNFAVCDHRTDWRGARTTGSARSWSKNEKRCCGVTLPNWRYSPTFYHLPTWYWQLMPVRLCFSFVREWLESCRSSEELISRRSDSHHKSYVFLLNFAIFTNTLITFGKSISTWLHLLIKTLPKAT